MCTLRGSGVIDNAASDLKVTRVACAGSLPTKRNLQ